MIAKKKQLKPIKKKKSNSQLKKELDTVYSQWIRLKDSKNGNATCVTCGCIRPWRDLQCGHYISRIYLATRFLESNTHVQCVSCNVFNHGNYTSYANFMIKKYGVEHLSFLDKEKNKITKYYPYESEIERYKILVAFQLERE